MYVRESEKASLDDRKCQQKESRRIMNTEIDVSNKVNKAHTESNDFIHSWLWYNWPAKLKVRSEESPGGGGVLPYKSDEGTRRKISRTPLKGTRISFYGHVLNSFPPLRGNNSTTTNNITGTANFNSNKDNFRTPGF